MPAQTAALWAVEKLVDQTVLVAQLEEGVQTSAGVEYFAGTTFQVVLTAAAVEVIVVVVASASAPGDDTAAAVVVAAAAGAEIPQSPSLTGQTCRSKSFSSGCQIYSPNPPSA